MTRNKKLLAMSLALCLLLGLAWGAGQITAKLEGTEEEEVQSLFQIDLDSATALSLSYEEELSFTKSGEEWIYDQDQAFPTSESQIQALINAMNAIQVNKTLEAGEDLDQYGLETPEAEISVTAGEKYSLSIGAETDLGGERYISTGDGSIYLTDSTVINDFTKGLLDLTQQEVLPMMEDLVSFTVKSGERSYEIDYLENSGLAYSDEYVWFLKDGDGYLTLDTVSADSFVSHITGLTWQSLVDYDATEEELQAYGLLDPALTVEVVYKEEVKTDSGLTDSDGQTIYDTQTQERAFVLELGDYVEESCYARIQGSSMVYTIDGELMDDLLYSSYEQMQPDEILIMDFSQVSSLDIELGAQTYSLDHSQEERETEEGETETVDLWTLEGREVDIQTDLDSITALTASTKGAEKEPTQAQLIRLVFHRDTETFKEVELIFYNYDSSDCLVSLNGTARLTADRAEVRSIVQSLQEKLEVEEDG